jgi:hypothetical protein
MSYFSQMAGLAVQNFLSAATGIAVLTAVVRGLGKSARQGLGDEAFADASFAADKEDPRPEGVLECPARGVSGRPVGVVRHLGQNITGSQAFQHLQLAMLLIRSRAYVHDDDCF